MAMSREYPDLTWVEPAAFEYGRPAGRPLWVVIHTTEGSEGLRSAEDGAAYDARRTDGTSTHYFADQDTVVQCVNTADRANAARATGNLRGIHHELCGVAAQNPTQWHDAASLGTLRNDAKQAARDCRRWGIPIKKLTVAEVRAFKPGFCEHNDISAAFGESDHTDPGRNYPWTEYLGYVRGATDGDSDVELTDKLFGGNPTDSWKNRYPGVEPTVQNVLAFAAYDAHDAEKAVNALKGDVTELKERLLTIEEALATLVNRA
jgi:hypothetical protein